MDNFLVESDEQGRKIFNTLVLDPKKLGILNNDIVLKIMSELKKNPSCAIDIARSLDVDGQKIYYYLRKLEDAGIIQLTKTERRHGMVAKIFSPIAPVLATKLYDDGVSLQYSEPIQRHEILEFLHPFIEDGRLNAKIVMGDPVPHGKYEKGSRDGPHVADLALFLGRFVTENKSSYKLDTHMKEKDFKNNLIIIGNPHVNIVAEKVNPSLPVYFNVENLNIVSKSTNKTYDDDFIGVIIKTRNPFDKRKHIMLIGGKRSRGTIASIIALTQHFDKLIAGNTKDNEIARVVAGMDRDGDGFIDHVHFLE